MSMIPSTPVEPRKLGRGRVAVGCVLATFAFVQAAWAFLHFDGQDSLLRQLLGSVAVGAAVLVLLDVGGRRFQFVWVAMFLLSAASAMQIGRKAPTDRRAAATKAHEGGVVKTSDGDWRVEALGATSASFRVRAPSRGRLRAILRRLGPPTQADGESVGLAEFDGVRKEWAVSTPCVVEGTVLDLQFALLAQSEVLATVAVRYPAAEVLDEDWLCAAGGEGAWLVPNYQWNDGRAVRSIVGTLPPSVGPKRYHHVDSKTLAWSGMLRRGRAEILGAWTWREQDAGPVEFPDLDFAEIHLWASTHPTLVLSIEFVAGDC